MNNTSFYTFRFAEPQEADTGFRLLAEAAAWLKEQGILHWQNWLTPSKEDVCRITDGFERKEFRFLEIEGTIVAMARLQERDKEHWGEDPTPALYIHSFTTARDMKGKAIGARLMREIEDEARAMGKEYVRLDCGAWIDGLNRYYRGLGFAFVREEMIGSYHANLYQKAVNT